MLSVNNISAGYDNIDVIFNVNLNLRAGEKLCIMGPNGCGKSTLLKVIGGLIRPTTGSVNILGENIFSINKKKLASKLSMLSQISAMYFSYSVYDTVMLGRYIHSGNGFFSTHSNDDKIAVEQALETVGMLDLAKKPMTSLSGGQMQRVFLARIFAQDPNIILLDEPTNHLDLQHQIELIDHLNEWVKKENRAIIGVFHDISLSFRLMDKIILMKEGNIIANGKTDEVLSKSLMNEVFSVDIDSYYNKSFSSWNALK